jgi:tRNA-specific 2-thiouridylase
MLNSLDLPGRPADTRVVVAMSGGVDSSVVAGLLKGEGYDVIGMTLQLYDHGAATHRKGACCAGRDIHDARRVAETLSIPHYVLDYETRFREAVIDPFAQSYVAGETPIPCVACNQTVKFADLLETARSLGAAALATGHYVSSRPAAPGSTRRLLYRPQDTARDQSYFLFATTQAQLDFLRFPLGGLDKARTRELARGMGLAVADKSDSQDICFVADGKYSELVARLAPEADRPGDIVHVDGRVLGRHDGIIHYTIGQRRGIGIAAGEPIYVVDLDAAGNRVIVGPRPALAANRLELRDVNWLGDGPLAAADGARLFVKVRSSRPPVDASLLVDAQGVHVELPQAESGVAPGQACVFYDRPGDGARVLGGGFIARAPRAAARAGEASLASA